MLTNVNIMTNVKYEFCPHTLYTTPTYIFLYICNIFMGVYVDGYQMCEKLY